MAFRLNLAPKRLLAVDWDARDVRVVMFRPKADGIDLLKAVSIPIPPSLSHTDAEAMGAFLREALRQARMSVKQVLLTIPRDRVVLNTLRLPPTPPDEMAAMVGFQVSKELPFAADQATIDFAVNGNPDPKAPVDLLVAAIRNEELEFYRKVAHEAGLTIESIGLRPHGNLVAVTHRAAQAIGTQLIVEVGPQLTEIDIVRDGVLAFSRAASVAVWQPETPVAEERIDDSRISTFPVQDRTPDDTSRKAVNAVLLEVVRSYEAYRATDPALRVGRIVVSGASGIEAELTTALGARFAVRAELYSADAALDLPAQRAKELRGFSAVLGLALNHASKGISHFDFHHPKKTISKRTQQMRKAPIAAAAALVFLVSGVVVRLNVVNPALAERDNWVGRLNAKKKDAEALEKFRKRVEAVQTWRDDEQHWPEVLMRLTSTFPPDDQAYATRLLLDTHSPQRGARRQSTIKVSLREATSDVVNTMVSRMKEMGFESVTPGPDHEITPIGPYRFEGSIDAVIPQRKLSPSRAPDIARSASSKPVATSEPVPTSAPAHVPEGKPVEAHRAAATTRPAEEEAAPLPPPPEAAVPETATPEATPATPVATQPTRVDPTHRVLPPDGMPRRPGRPTPHPASRRISPGGAVEKGARP